MRLPLWNTFAFATSNENGPMYDVQVSLHRICLELVPYCASHPHSMKIYIFRYRILHIYIQLNKPTSKIGKKWFSIQSNVWGVRSFSTLYKNQYTQNGQINMFHAYTDASKSPYFTYSRTYYVYIARKRDRRDCEREMSKWILEWTFYVHTAQSTQ